MKKLALLFALTCIPILGHGQGFNYQNSAQGPSGAPIGGATITVCTSAGTGYPCTPLATIYGADTPAGVDPTLVDTKANPFTTDGQGNYAFSVAPGTYVITITKTGATPLLQQLTIPCVVGSDPLIDCGGGGSGTSDNIWDSTKDYVTNDLVTYGGNPYIALGSSTNKIPNYNPTYWRQLSPNDFYSVTNYGARTYASGSMYGTTCTITASSSTATVGSASGLQKGDGFACFGAGAANAVSTPAAPTVTPVVAAGPLGSGLVSNASGGLTSYTYKIVGFKKGGGYTVASAAGSTSTGAATLGSHALTFTGTATRSGTLNTYTTTTPHGVPTLAWGQVTGTSEASADHSFDGWGITWTGTTGSTITMNFAMDSNVDANVPTSATGGTAYFFFGNHITWTWDSNVEIYAIYKFDGANYNFLGMSLPKGAGSATAYNAFFDDWGATISGNWLRPAWVPATAPVSATADTLVTTITAISGNTLTLADAATTSVTSALASFDNEPAILATVNAAIAGGGIAYIPCAAFGSYYATATYLTLPQTTSILQCGGIYAGNTISRAASTHWTSGYLSSGIGHTQFGVAPGAIINCGMSPCVLDNNADSSHFAGLYLWAGSATNNALLELGDETQSTIWENMQYLTGSSNADNLGKSFVARSYSPNFFDNKMDTVSFVGGPEQNRGQTTASQVMCLSNSNHCGSMDVYNSFWNRRGFSCISCITHWNFYGHNHLQGPITPAVTAANQGTGLGDSVIQSFIIDSEQSPTFANASYGPFLGTITIDNSPAIVNIPTVTGFPVTQLIPIGQQNFLGQNVNTSQDCSIPILGIPTYAKTNQLYCAQRNTMVFPSSTSLLWPLAMPTGIAKALVAGGSVADGTYYYAHTIVDNNSRESGLSLADVVSATTGAGNNTVRLTWSASTGAKCYNVYRSTLPTSDFSIIAGGSCVAALTVDDTSASTTGTPAPGASSAAAVGISKTDVTAPLFILYGTPSAGISYKGTLTPSTFSANRTFTFPDASGTVSLLSAASCGTTTTCANTDYSSSARIVRGTVVLSSGTPSTAVITGISPAFTSTTSFNCVLTNMSDATNNLLSVANTSTSSITITGPATNTDTISYICTGN